MNNWINRSDSPLLPPRPDQSCRNQNSHQPSCAQPLCSRIEPLPSALSERLTGEQQRETRAPSYTQWAISHIEQLPSTLSRRLTRNSTLLNEQPPTDRRSIKKEVYALNHYTSLQNRLYRGFFDTLIDLIDHIDKKRDGYDQDNSQERHILAEIKPLATRLNLYCNLFDLNDNRQLSLRILKLAPAAILIKFLNQYQHPDYTPNALEEPYRLNQSILRSTLVDSVCSAIEQQSKLSRLPILNLKNFVLGQPDLDRFNLMFGRVEPDALIHYINFENNNNLDLLRIAVHHYIQSEGALDGFAKQLKNFLHGRKKGLTPTFHTVRYFLDINNLTHQQETHLKNIIDNVDFKFFIEKSPRPLCIDNIEDTSQTLSHLIFGRMGFYLARDPIKLLRDNIEQIDELRLDQFQALFSQLTDEQKTVCLIISLIEPLYHLQMEEQSTQFFYYLPVITALLSEPYHVQQPITDETVDFFQTNYRNHYYALTARNKVTHDGLNDIIQTSLYPLIICHALKNQKARSNQYTIEVARNNMVNSLMGTLLSTGSLTFQIKFENESGQDEGGLTREAYTLTHHAIAEDPSLWEISVHGHKPAAKLSTHQLMRLYHLGCIWSVMLLEDIPTGLPLSKPTWRCINFLATMLTPISQMPGYIRPGSNLDQLPNILDNNIALLTEQFPNVVLKAACILENDEQSMTQALQAWLQLDNPQEASLKIEEKISGKPQTSQPRLTREKTLEALEQLNVSTTLNELTQEALIHCKNFKSVFALTLGFIHKELFQTNCLVEVSDFTHYLLFNQTNIRDTLKLNLKQSIISKESDSAPDTHLLASYHFMERFIDDLSTSEMDLHHLTQFVTGTSVTRNNLKILLAPKQIDGFVGRTCINQLDVPTSLLSKHLERVATGAPMEEIDNQTYAEFKQALLAAIDPSDMRFNIL